jgi:hypothetical protein
VHVPNLQVFQQDSIMTTPAIMNSIQPSQFLYIE